jgi:hypothetical protein
MGCMCMLSARLDENFAELSFGLCAVLYKLV